MRLSQHPWTNLGGGGRLWTAQDLTHGWKALGGGGQGPQAQGGVEGLDKDLQALPWPSWLWVAQGYCSHLPEPPEQAVGNEGPGGASWASWWPGPKSGPAYPPRQH